MRATGFLLAVLISLGAAPVWAADVTADPRLGPVRERLEEILADAEKAGLPAEVVASKIREGLAKGVDAARIEATASRLAKSMKAAHGFIADRRAGKPPAELVQALAEADLAGVEIAATDRLVRAKVPTTETRRGVEVLTDLTLRGYPTGRASAIVSQVLRRDPKAVGRVSATLEEIRHSQALTHVEATEALESGLGSGGNLEAARGKAMAEARKGGKGSAGASKSARGGAGKSDFVPPGQLKKLTGAKGRPDNPGRDNPGRGNPGGGNQ